MVGQFFTPEIVAKCMFELAGARKGQSAIDPSCGDGSFLRAVPAGVEIKGAEIDPVYADIARKLVGEGAFFPGDALSSLVPVWGEFDLAIGNPPFSAQARLERRLDTLKHYDLAAGRKSQCLEVLFLELFLKLVKPNGRLAIILPDGPLSNRPFSNVRSWLLCRAQVEAIISLPRGIFRGTAAKTNIIIAQKLPYAAEAYRGETALLECRDLNELKPLPLPEWRKVERRWSQVVLADVGDWRPEANGGIESDGGAVLRLGDVFELRTGRALYGANRELYDDPEKGRIILIRAKNLDPNGGFRLDTNCAYISPTSGMFSEKSVVCPGEILFVRVGAGCYGRTALVPRGMEAQADDWIHILTPTRSVDGAAVVAWFNSPRGRAAVLQLAKGVGTLSISKSSLAELRMPADLCDPLFRRSE
jgi:type I restriction enzyme M protein